MILYPFGFVWRPKRCRLAIFFGIEELVSKLGVAGLVLVLAG